jgi:hypothetical protein
MIKPEFVNIDDVRPIFLHATNVTSRRVQDYVLSEIRKIKPHFAQSQIIRDVERRRIQFVAIRETLPAFAYMNSRESYCYLNLSTLDKTGSFKPEFPQIDPIVLYCGLYCASTLIILDRLPDRKLCNFYTSLSRIFLAIFYNVFGRRYGLQSTTKEKNARFALVTQITVGLKLFSPCYSANDIYRLAKKSIWTKHADLTKIGDISKLATWQGYCDYLNNEILPGFTYPVFKKIMYTRLRIFMLIAFDYVRYSIALFAGISQRSGNVLPDFLRYSNSKAFEHLEQLLKNTY